MSIGNLIFDVTRVAVSYLICYGSLLHNVTDIITKCDRKFITKCDRSLLQNVSGFLLQNATILLQNVTVITNCDNFITKFDSYYKMRCSLQIATVHVRLIKASVVMVHQSIKEPVLLIWLEGGTFHWLASGHKFDIYNENLT